MAQPTKFTRIKSGDSISGLTVHTAPDLTLAMVAKTTAYTVLSTDFANGQIFNNTGASGAVTFTLPAPSAVEGLCIGFVVVAAQDINISPASTDGVYLNGSGVVNKDAIVAGTAGNYAWIYSNGSSYEVIRYLGVTKEA